LTLQIELLARELFDLHLSSARPAVAGDVHAVNRQARGLLAQLAGEVVHAEVIALLQLLQHGDSPLAQLGRHRGGNGGRGEAGGGAGELIELVVHLPQEVARDVGFFLEDAEIRARACAGGLSCCGLGGASGERDTEQERRDEAEARGHGDLPVSMRTRREMSAVSDRRLIRARTAPNPHPTLSRSTGRGEDARCNEFRRRTDMGGEKVSGLLRGLDLGDHGRG
jgi:hypothetical protein